MKSWPGVQMLLQHIPACLGNRMGRGSQMWLHAGLKTGDFRGCDPVPDQKTNLVGQLTAGCTPRIYPGKNRLLERTVRYICEYFCYSGYRNAFF